MYKFSIESSFIVVGLSFKIDDKQVDAKIVKKVAAKEMYDDAIASGKSAIQLNYDGNDGKWIKLNIGLLPSQKVVEISVKIIWELEAIKHGFYSFIFPIDMLPNCVDNNGNLIHSSLSYEF